VQVVCRVLGVARSSYYHQASAKPDEAAIRQALEREASAYPTYGSRRLTVQLRRSADGWRINRKRIQRLMRRLGLIRPRKRRPPRTTNSQHGFRRYPNLVKTLVIERPDQVWVADITYVQLARDEVYLAILMDVFTRSLRGWHLSRALGQELVLAALNRALTSRQPEIHHSDQGGQYAATAYTQRLGQIGTQISMTAVGKATENGYAERVIRTIKEEEVYLSDYATLAEATAQIGHFIDEVYQHKRIHSALGYLTPAEFEAQWFQTTLFERV
jgi:Transposase and inactivated derivatives